MDRARHPYTPNPGAPPRYFAGRAAEVEDFRVLLRRLAAGYAEQSVVVTGLRGETWSRARRARLAICGLKMVLFDTGILTQDLVDVFEAVGEAAKERDSGVIFLFDEIHFLGRAELETLIGAVHRTVQRRLPVSFAGAGLPQLTGLAGEAKSYAERLFKFPLIGELPDTAAREALVEPARAEGVYLQPDAVAEILRYTEGYPYFLQEYGRAAWNLAAGPTITRDVEAAGDVVDAELDESFFRTRVQRSSPEELRYMRAMAHLGPEAHKAADVAGVLGEPPSRSPRSAPASSVRACCARRATGTRSSPSRSSTVSCSATWTSTWYHPPEHLGAVSAVASRFTTAIRGLRLRSHTCAPVSGGQRLAAAITRV